MRHDLIVQSAIIAGKYINDDKVITVLNPYDHRWIGTVPSLGTDMINHAIAVAKRALPEWQNKSAKERSFLLRKWYDLVIEHIDDLAMIMTMEQGKPLLESQAEVKYAASFIEWYAEEAKRIYGDIVPSPIKDSKIIITKQPVGVCAAITPWNFPSAMVTRKVAPALAAGCTMILKPASKTPFSALALAKLALEAGIPDGVFNVVTGQADEIGKIFATHNDIKKLSFTGSTEIGKKLMAMSSQTVKRLSLELGGNAPFIIFADADINLAVEGLMIAKFRNSGQTCICANRIFIHKDIQNKFLKELTKEVAKLNYGNGMDRDSNQGPLISEGALDKVDNLIADALQKGAKLIVGGKRHGNCFIPTIISNISSEMKIFHEEIFAPVISLIAFENDDQVISMANDTLYGLASYIYIGDIAKGWKIAERLEYGMVAINKGILSTEVAPFGGIKQSGFGREGSYMGIEEYLNTKYMLVAV